MASKKSNKNVKKRFFDVNADITAMKIQLYASDSEELIGKNVVLDLTRNLRGKGLILSLIIKAEGEKLIGKPFKIVLAGSYLRRIIRKGSDYVEDSFLAECKDIKARAKLFLITRKRVSRAVRKVLRNAAKKYFEGYIKTREAEEVFKDIISNKIQKGLSEKLRKIYPLSVSEVKWFEVVGEKTEEIKEEKSKKESIEESFESE